MSRLNRKVPDQPHLFFIDKEINAIKSLVSICMAIYEILQDIY